MADLAVGSLLLSMERGSAGSVGDGRSDHAIPTAVRRGRRLLLCRCGRRRRLSLGLVERRYDSTPGRA
jgi:hypothetical protein